MCGLHNLIYTLLAALLSFASCYGQVKPAAPTSSAGSSKTTPIGNPKLVKMQGTNRYANVSCGLRDRAGKLWFGTTGEGLYRYDGKLFTNFTIKDGLISNTFYSICEDKAGNIWFGTDVGVVCRYDGKSFVNIPVAASSGSSLFTNALLDTSSKKNEVVSILQDKSGKLWFGTNAGMYCYDGVSFSRFLDNDGVINKDKLQLKSVQDILQDKAGNLWFTTWFEGVCRYNGKSIVAFKPNGEVWFDPLFEDSKGNIWVGRRDQGVCRYDGKTFTNVLQNGVFDSCGITSIVEDKRGDIWFGTEYGPLPGRDKMGGLWRYDGKIFQNFTTKDGLSNNTVHCIVKDTVGNLWLGTRNTGLCLYDGKTFTSFGDTYNSSREKYGSR